MSAAQALRPPPWASDASVPPVPAHEPRNEESPAGLTTAGLFFVAESARRLLRGQAGVVSARGLAGRAGFFLRCPAVAPKKRRSTHSVNGAAM